MFHSSKEETVVSNEDGYVVVFGKPVSQKRHRHTFQKGRIRNYDPSSKEKTKFRKEIAKLSLKKLSKGAISLSLTFYMPRPKAHYRTGKFKHLLKHNSPSIHIVKPDIDNLAKFIMDSLQGILWNDDCFVSVLEAKKIYSSKPRTEIEYWKIKGDKSDTKTKSTKLVKKR